MTPPTLLPAVKFLIRAMKMSDAKALAAEALKQSEKLIAENPMETPLDPDKMVIAFRIWDETVGGAKKK